MSGTASLEVIKGDITLVPADAIVNAANRQLAAGGGVCGAIFAAAGPQELAAACKRLGQCETGEAVVTPAYAIKSARVIIHAVGPIYSEHSEDDARNLLRKAYASAIALAVEEGCSSIAFPAISTGIYGYPLKPACLEAVDVCRLEGGRAGLHIKLVAFDERTYSCLRETLDVAH